MADRERKRHTDDGGADGSSKRHKSDRPSSSRHSSSGAAASASSSHRHSSSSGHHGSSSRPQPVDMAKASKAFIPAADGASSSKKPKSEFLCDLQYTNYLPDIPFEPKLLKMHLPPQRLIRYCASSLESSLRLPYLPDKLLGMPLDLLHPELYVRPAGVKMGQLAPEDESLLPTTRDPLAAGTRAQPTRLQLFQQGSSNWLRKQEFQSNNPYEMGIKSFGAADSIKKEGSRIDELKQAKKEENSREKQLQLIEETFILARQPPVHPTNKSLQAVEILDIFPDFAPASEEPAEGASPQQLDYALAANIPWVPSLVEGEEADAAALEAEAKAKAAHQRAACFNVEYTWAEFDYAPMEDKAAAPAAASADAMQVDAGAAAAAAPAPKPVPLIKSYTAQHHGFYLSDPLHPYGPVDGASIPADAGAGEDSDDDDGTSASKRRAAAAAARAAAQAAQATQDDPNVRSSEYYRWTREYVKVPTPRVDRANNYFFVLKRGSGAAPSTIHYTQYGERIKIAKRTKTRTDKAFHEIQKRPSAVHVHYVKEVPQQGAAAGEEEEEEGEEEAEEDDDEEAEGSGAEEGEDEAEAEGEAEGADAEAEEGEGEAAAEEEADEPSSKKSKKKSKKHKKERKQEKAKAEAASSDDE